MTDSDPVSPLSARILRAPCFMSLQMLPAMSGEQGEEGQPRYHAQSSENQKTAKLNLKKGKKKNILPSIL